MIKRIVEADNEAKALEEANRKAAEEEKKRIDREAEEIYAKYMREAEETIKKNDAHQEHRTEKKWQEISAKQASALIKLNSEYERNCDRWVDIIVSRTLE